MLLDAVEDAGGMARAALLTSGRRPPPYGVRKRLYLDRIKTEPADYLLAHGAEVIDKFNADAGQVLTYYTECLAIAKERHVVSAILVPLELAVN